MTDKQLKIGYFILFIILVYQITQTAYYNGLSDGKDQGIKIKNNIKSNTN